MSAACTPQEMRELLKPTVLLPDQYVQRQQDIRDSLAAAADRQEAVEALLEVTPVLMYGIPRKPVDVVLADDIRTALATDTTPEPQQETT